MACNDLKANRQSTTECSRIVQEYKNEMRAYADRLETSLSFMDVLVSGAKLADGWSPVPKSGMKKKESWSSALGKMKSLLSTLD